MLNITIPDNTSIQHTKSSIKNAVEIAIYSCRETIKKYDENYHKLIKLIPYKSYTFTGHYPVNLEDQHWLFDDNFFFPNFFSDQESRLNEISECFRENYNQKITFSQLRTYFSEIEVMLDKINNVRNRVNLSKNPKEFNEEVKKMLDIGYPIKLEGVIQEFNALFKQIHHENLSTNDFLSLVVEKKYISENFNKIESPSPNNVLLGNIIKIDQSTQTELSSL